MRWSMPAFCSGRRGAPIVRTGRDLPVERTRRPPTFLSDGRRTQQICLNRVNLVASASSLSALVPRRPTPAVRPAGRARSRSTSLDARLRRDVRARPAGRGRTTGALLEELRVGVARRAAPAPDRGRPGVPDAGHHLHRLRRRAGHRADLSVRPAAADHHRRASGTRSSAA